MRRTLSAAAGLLIVLATAGPTVAHMEPALRRPNILIIITDDQRGGVGRAVMPETRKWFSKRGVRYTNAFATTPLCCPSRASIFSGRYAHNTGVKRNEDALALDHSRTTQAYLQDAGYRTAIFGKFLNRAGQHAPPYFDEWAICNSCSKAYIDGRWNINGTERIVSRYVTRFLGDQAISFIDSSQNHPWLMYVTTPNPHAPYTAEEKYQDAWVPGWSGNPAVFERNKSDKPLYVQSASMSFAKGSRHRAKQFRTLMSVDDMVARIMTKLHTAGELENTLAFFLSDNGFMWAEHGLWSKRVPYSQSIRVPMFARWPDHLPVGVDDRLVANIDIAPTALDAADVRLPDGSVFDGHSLLSAHRRDHMFTEAWLGGVRKVPTWASLVTLHDQYVEYYDSEGARTFTEYYDLEDDPWQLRNVYRDGVRSNDPDTKVLHDQLLQDSTCAGSTCP